MDKGKIKIRMMKAARVIVVLSLLGGGTYAYQRYQKKQLPVSGVFHGNVDIRDVTLAFRVAGRVDEVLKNEGDPVVSGEVLARLDKQPFELEMTQAQAASEVAAAQLKNVEAGARREDISQARAVLAERKSALARAEDTFERIKRLESTGAATTQALVDARSAAEQTKSAVEAAQANLSKLQNGARSEEIGIALAQATQAEAAVSIAQLRLADTELRAQTAGVVVTRAIEPGAMVQAGTPALVVSLSDPVWVRAFAPAKELSRLAPGTPVQVFTDARPERPYAGQVGYVSPQAEFTPKNVETEELRSSLVYRFRVIVKEHDGGLRQGMPVSVRLSTATGPSSGVP